ncbi:LysR family transcriptional regulator [Ensifer aridi]|uniref:LysR family transcriptional regulator n=1 Tax=Ensifer aridi TaxID=1708715 RepID=UPI000A119888|nr:LysR family transcriptional regulator [Ensifer aridi]
MSINRISLYHFETLIWIARLGTFAAAADKLNTTQPAISARMSELEERLGAKLFRKVGRSSKMTPAGRELVREYLPIFEQLQGALLRSAGSDHMRGVVHVAAGEIAAATCLPGFIAQMKDQWPDLAFEIEIELTAQMIEALLSGKVDLAFAAGMVGHPALLATPIGTVELLWVASPNVAREMDEGIIDRPLSLWSLPSHSPIYHLMKEGLAGLLIPQRAINLCNNVRTMIEIVTMGNGFSLLPRSMVARELEVGSLVSVMSDRRVEPITFHVVSRVGESDPVVKAILRCASAIELS